MHPKCSTEVPGYDDKQGLKRVHEQVCQGFPCEVTCKLESALSLLLSVGAEEQVFEEWWS